MNSASLCILAGRYDNPIPTRFLAPIDCLKIPALLFSASILPPSSAAPGSEPYTETLDSCRCIFLHYMYSHTFYEPYQTAGPQPLFKLEKILPLPQVGPVSDPPHPRCLQLKILHSSSPIILFLQEMCLHCKKGLAVFPSPAGMSLIKLFLGGNNLVFPAQREFDQ